MEAIAMTHTWQPHARRQREEWPLAEPLLLTIRAFALWLAGRLVEAAEPAQCAYERELERRSAQYSALAAGTLSVIWLARGRVRTALRWSRESTALLRDVDAVGMLPWTLAGLAQAAAQAGEPELARRAVQDMELRPIGHKASTVRSPRSRPRTPPPSWRATVRAAGGRRRLRRAGCPPARRRGRPGRRRRAPRDRPRGERADGGRALRPAARALRGLPATDAARRLGRGAHAARA